MTDRFVSVGDDLTLPSAVKVPAARIPDLTEALSSTYAHALPALYDSYGDAPDGAPASADSGHAWTHTSNGVAGSALTVASGKLTNTASNASTAAGYLTTALADSVARIGCDFVLNGGTTTGGGITLAVWKTNLPEGNIAAIPDSPCHLVITQNQWDFGVWSGGNMTQIRTGRFRSALDTTGATRYRAEVLLDKATNTITLMLPDGDVKTFTDSRVTTNAGAFACFEVYQYTASTDAKASFVNIWADSATVNHRNPAPTIGDLAGLLHGIKTANSPVVLSYAPSNENVTIPSAEEDISTGHLDIYFTGPNSGKMLIEMTAYVDLSTMGRYIWALKQGSYTAAFMIVRKSTGAGYVTARKLVTNLTPGGQYTLTWRHFILDGGAGTVNLDGNTPAIITATPVA